MGIRNWLARLGLAGRDPGVPAKKAPRNSRAERTVDSATVRISVAEIEEAAEAATVRIETGSSPEVTTVVPAPEDTVRVPFLEDRAPASAGQPTEAVETKAADTLVVDPGGATAGHDTATEYFAVESGQAPELVGVLVATQGPQRGEIYRVEDGENRIGRENANIRLRSSRVSRFHARVHHAAGRFTIESNPEIRENNPTYLNGKPVFESPLGDGDEILVGDCSLKFRTL